MTELTEAAGRVIAADMVSAFAATDGALLASATVTQSTLQGTIGSNLHPRAKQKLLEALHDGQAQILAGRRRQLDAHATMVAIQRNSSLRETDYYCWGGPEEEKKSFFTSGELEPQPATPAADCA